MYSMYFLAGVADAEIFKGTESFATAKTLIDSSITIGVSAEDIRAGKGAKLYGKYFHTSTFDLKLSDAMFKLEYIAANVGAELELGGDVFRMEEVKVTADDRAVTLADVPVALNAGGDIYVYYKKDTEEYFKSVKHTADTKEFNVPGTEEGTYCVKYLYTNDSARKVVINANFIPDTLSIYLTANLYAGDVNNISTGTRVGTVTIKVPRFLLSGSQEIAMSMTGAANTPLEGSALAMKSESCDGEGIYAEIIEVIEGRTYHDMCMIKIQSDEDGLIIYDNETEKIRVYGRFLDTGLAVIKNELVKFVIEDDAIVKINEHGVITPLQLGSTYIHAHIGDIYDTALITVVSNFYQDDDVYEHGLYTEKNTILTVDENTYISYEN